MRYEKYLFLLLVVLHLLPVALLEYFVTHDGPSHVYNSHIITWLLGNDELTSRFFLFNPHPEPNWIGHALLIFFNFFFAGNISERILIALYIAGLPLSFRYLALTLNKNAFWVSYLVFPFIYSLLFYLGFYNFCIGIPVLFYSTAFLLRSGTRLNSKKIILLAVLALLMYFSHIFVLLMFVPVVYLYVLSETFFAPREKTIFSFIKNFFIRAKGITLALLPCFILSVFFVISHPQEDDLFREMTFMQQLEFIFEGRPLITLDYDEEKYYAIVFAVIFWFMYVATILKRTKHFKPIPGDWFFLVSLFTLAVFFLLPDAMASGSFVSYRLMLFFYLFSMLWLGCNELNASLKNFSAPVFALLSIFILVYHYNKSKYLEGEAKEFVSVADSITDQSVVLPVNYANNWLHHNLSNYIPGEKHIIILDNYEAAKPHFPTMWKAKMDPYAIMDFNSLAQLCMALDRYEKTTGVKIDYIIRWGFNNSFNDSCATAISNYLEENYSPIFVSENNKAELFRRKKK